MNVKIYSGRGKEMVMCGFCLHLTDHPGRIWRPSPDSSMTMHMCAECDGRESGERVPCSDAKARKSMLIRQRASIDSELLALS